MVLMPSMIVSGGGNHNVQLNPGMIVFGGRGGRGNEGMAQTDGIGTGAAINGGGVSGYGRLDTPEEVVMTTAGGLGEAEVGGPIVNLVPRTGGNTFQHRFQGSGMTGAMQSSNYTQALKDAGLTTPAETNYLVGHEPVERRADQEGSALVLLLDLRTTANGNDARRHVLQQERRRPHQVDLRAGPEPSGQQQHPPGTITPTLRLTAQVTPRDKLNMFWDAGAFRLSDPPQIGGVAGPTLASPETGTVDRRNGSSRLQQIRWTSTLTNRLLLEAGLGTYQQNWNGRERPGNNRELIRVTEQCAGGCPNNGNIAEPDLSRAELEHRLHVAEPVEHVGDLRHRRAQPEGRLSWVRSTGTPATPPPTTTTSHTASTTACRTSSRRI